MKVLIIGQLPKEIGGNYTTGAANVVYELSKQKAGDVVYYIYGTNITHDAAAKVSSFPNRYIGYKIRPLRMLIHIVSHPLLTWRSLNHYRKVDHQNVFRYAFYEDNIREAIKIVQPDLIHVNSIANISPVRFAIGKNHIPMLLTCHGIFYRGDESDVVNRDRNLGNIKLADAYSGLTQESLEEYESILGVPKDKVMVIPNGVDCQKFYFSPDERAKIREEFGLSDDCRVFITVASIQERKGQMAFINLVSRFDIDVQYWIVGKGPDEKVIKEFVQLSGLEGKVKLLGYKTAGELYKYYSAADIYVHSSWKEGQALSELEANATGLRTIVNKEIIGTIASNVNSEDYYVLDFDNVDVASLVEWIQRDQKERSSRTTFDWSVIAKEYLNLYNQIIKEYKR